MNYDMTEQLHRWFYLAPANMQVVYVGVVLLAFGLYFQLTSE